MRDLEACLQRLPDKQRPALRRRIAQLRAGITRSRLAAWQAAFKKAKQLAAKGDYARARPAYDAATVGLDPALPADLLRGAGLQGGLYDAACIYAVLSTGKRGPRAAPSPIDPAEAARLRGRALALLDQAVALGYGDAAHARRDPDLFALRGEPRFNSLLQRMARDRKR